MNKTITCINCPVGCRMTVTLNDEGEVLSVSGNTCPRGAKYARQECTMPVRMLTAVVPVDEVSLPLSVKTSIPIPKNLIPAVVELLGGISVSAPVQIGDILIRNILDTGADIIATRNIPA